jgi:DDE superfamily endonuclease
LERPWLTEDKFRQKYRVSRKLFDTLLGLIKNHPVFLSSSKTGRPQASPATQLMILLKYLGTGGSGNSNPDLRDVFIVGRGTVQLYRDRAMTAVLSLRKQAITWPDEEERQDISKRIQKESIFPNCIGFIDGTLFPLAFCPSTKDTPDYSGRKHSYSLSVLIINDDQCMIRYYLSGWPGSSHDNRIWCNSDVYQRPHDYFLERQYLLGDSAFENSWFMVSSYKCPKGMELGRTEEIFNAALAKPRISAEHTIGMLKGRFPWLRSIRMKITEKKKSLKII